MVFITNFPHFTGLNIEMFLILPIFPGDSLTFNWEGAFHNVEKVDKQGYQNCDGFSNTEGVEGPYVFTAKRTGEFYFVCGVRHGKYLE